MRIKQILAFTLLSVSPLTIHAQRILCLDSCRALALRNNKQLSAARVKQDVAANARKAARTKYLPHVAAVGSYIYTNREISMLSDDQKAELQSLGTTAAAGMPDMSQQISATMTQLVQKGVITLEQAQSFSQSLSSTGTLFSTALNNLGQNIVDAYRTDTRNFFAGSIFLSQPIFMGGMIVSANRLADLGEEMAAESATLSEQNTLHSIDRAYWTVVSVRNKQKLAESYLKLVTKLDDDMKKMLSEGVITRSDELSVAVKVNEAEMRLTEANDGVVLSKMVLCQLCGLPLDADITLKDETSEDTSAYDGDITPPTDAADNGAARPELKMLSTAVAMSEQTTRMIRSEYLPHIALTGGYAISNPNMFNGFQKRWGGVWNMGVTLAMPLWTWGESAYKIRASKGATGIAKLSLSDIEDKIDLQVSQCRFRVDEAGKKLAMAQSNIDKADENLRSATLGFREGVINSTTVMEAQTAWLEARSQKIDAEIDVRMSYVDLEKALGTLTR